MFGRLGSARVSRAGFGVSPKQSSEVREGRDAFANTRDACATRIHWRGSVFKSIRSPVFSIFTTIVWKTQMSADFIAST
jgi:hypothetical protein